MIKLLYIVQQHVKVNTLMLRKLEDGMLKVGVGKTLVTTTAYASYGRGGGVSSNSTLKIPQLPQNYGQYDFQGVYFLNSSTDSTTGSIPNCSKAPDLVNWRTASLAALFRN